MNRIKSIKASGAKEGHKWQKVRDYILSEVVAGNFGPGDAIPSENYICEQGGISRSTVRQAFHELENEGLLYRVKGKGTFLADLKTSKKSARNELFGLVIPTIRRSLYPSLTQGFDDSLSSDRYQTLICQTNNDVDRQGNIVLRLLHKGIDGIAMVPTTDNLTPAFHIQHLLDNNTPIVLCHRPVDDVEVPVLYWDRQEVGRMAGKILLEHHHKRIAYYGLYRYDVTEAHVKGLREILSQSGVELPNSRIIFGSPDESPDQDSSREQMLSHFISEQKPTAVFCNDDDEAERLYWAANNMGLSVPGDISIIGFGDCHRGTFTRKFLSSIVIDEYKLGQKAAQVLCAIKSGQLNMRDPEKIRIGLDVYYSSSIARL